MHGLLFWPIALTETIFLVQIQIHFYKSEIRNSYTQSQDKEAPKKKKRKKKNLKEGEKSNN